MKIYASGVTVVIDYQDGSPVNYIPKTMVRMDIGLTVVGVENFKNNKFYRADISTVKNGSNVLVGNRTQVIAYLTQFVGA
jgi:hypothetical protein